MACGMTDTDHIHVCIFDRHNAPALRADDDPTASSAEPIDGLAKLVLSSCVLAAANFHRIQRRVSPNIGSFNPIAPANQQVHVIDHGLVKLVAVLVILDLIGWPHAVSHPRLALRA